VIERAPGHSSLIDVLDRVLDKGIVIDAWVRVSVVGIELATDEARLVVASIAMYLSHAEVPERRRQVVFCGPHDVDRGPRATVTEYG